MSFRVTSLLETSFLKKEIKILLKLLNVHLAKRYHCELCLSSLRVLLSKWPVSQIAPFFMCFQCVF